MLRSRLIAAAAILTPFILLLIADVRWNGKSPGSWLILPGLAIGLLASSELLDMFRTAGWRPLGWAVYGGVALIFLAASAPIIMSLTGHAFPANCPLGPAGLILASVALAISAVFVGEMRRFETPGGAVVQLALAVLAIGYVGIPLAFAVMLRQFRGNTWGMTALISVIVVVKLSDTGAYFVGRKWGRRKLSPRISPGKTIEGVVGGLLAAWLASDLFLRFIAPWMSGDASYAPNWSGAAVYGVVLAVVGLLGDLSESLIKRDVQRKDSSSWLPGLGGVLDIMDSLFFAFPAAYVCWAAGLVGPG